MHWRTHNRRQLQPLAHRQLMPMMGCRLRAAMMGCRLRKVLRRLPQLLLLSQVNPQSRHGMNPHSWHVMHPWSTTWRTSDDSVAYSRAHTSSTTKR